MPDIRQWLKGLPQRLRPHLLSAALGVSVAFVAVVLGMRFFFAPLATKVYLRAETSRDVMGLALLQDRHRRWTGVYADDLESLVAISGDPKGFTASLARHLDINTLLVRATSTHFTIEANVLDKERTLIHFDGPLPEDPAQSAP